MSGSDEENGRTSSTKFNGTVKIGTLADAREAERGGGGENDGEDGGSKKGRYIYCDFAQIGEEEYDVDFEIDQEGLTQALEEATAMAAAQVQQQSHQPYAQHHMPIVRASGWVRSQRFPVKLYALLAQPQLSQIISWMPHGRSWKVLKPRIFETTVLPGKENFLQSTRCWAPNP